MLPWNELMDNVERYVMNINSNLIQLHNGDWYRVEVNINIPMTIDHYALVNDKRAIAFDSWDELRGWLRAMRTEYTTHN